MSYKPKSRFGYRGNGETKELFSIKDLKDKGIVISRNHQKGLIEEDRTYLLRDQHYSVHARGKSGTLITQKSNYVGRVRSRTAFVKHTSKDYLFYPVVRSLVGLSGPGNNLLTNKSRDFVLIAEGNLDYEISTMFYNLYVSSRDVKSFSLPQGTSVGSFGFDLYVVHVCCNYIRLPTLESSFSLFEASSTQEVDGIRDSNHKQWTKESIDPDGFADQHMKAMQFMIHAYLLRLSSYLKKSDPTMEGIAFDIIYDRLRLFAQVLRGMP